MSNLQKIYSKRQEGLYFISEVNKAVESTIERIKDSLDQSVKDYVSKAEVSTDATVKSILPAINKIVADSLGPLANSQGEMKRFVQNVRIPDNSPEIKAIAEQIRKIVIPAVDFKPVLAKLDELLEKVGEEKEEPKWVFTVNRDPITKLMDSVTAEVVEGEE